MRCHPGVTVSYYEWVQNAKMEEWELNEIQFVTIPTTGTSGAFASSSHQ